jgi:hypothetical protein
MLASKKKQGARPVVSLRVFAQVRGVNEQLPGEIADFQHLGGTAGHNVGYVRGHEALKIGGDFVLAGQNFLGNGRSGHGTRRWSVLSK